MQKFPQPQLRKRIQETSLDKKNRREGLRLPKKSSEQKKDVPAFEQPNAAQKFSAQEFLKALRSAKKERNDLAVNAGCSKESTSLRRTRENWSESPGRIASRAKR
jgi:hypothetical protein